jgi:uncharacterized membrane protein
MILLLHILIALISVVIATYSFLSPSRAVLRGSYAFIALTLISGTVLVLSSPGHMIQACVSGLVYVSAVTAIVAAAKAKLARAS